MAFKFVIPLIILVIIPLALINLPVVNEYHPLLTKDLTIDNSSGIKTTKIEITIPNDYIQISGKFRVNSTEFPQYELKVDTFFGDAPVVDGDLSTTNANHGLVYFGFVFNAKRNPGNLTFNIVANSFNSTYDRGNTMVHLEVNSRSVNYATVLSYDSNQQGSKSELLFTYIFAIIAIGITLIVFFKFDKNELIKDTDDGEVQKNMQELKGNAPKYLFYSGVGMAIFHFLSFVIILAFLHPEHILSYPIPGLSLLGLLASSFMIVQNRDYDQQKIDNSTIFIKELVIAMINYPLLMASIFVTIYSFFG